MKFAIVVAVQPNIKALGLTGNFEESVRRVAKAGYDGIELFGRPTLNILRVKELVKSYGLEIAGFGTGWAYVEHGLSFTAPSNLVRKKAVEKIKDFINVAWELDTKIIIGSVKGREEKNYERGWNWLRTCLKKCSRFAEEVGVDILLEPLNRYESNIINTLSEGIKLIKEVGSERIKLLADTFHMNIEEPSAEESIKKAGSYIAYVHVADSNRWAPGHGHINFKNIAKALREVKYGGYISVECLPKPNYETFVESSLNFLKEFF